MSVSYGPEPRGLESPFDSGRLLGREKSVTFRVMRPNMAWAEVSFVNTLEVDSKRVSNRTLDVYAADGKQDHCYSPAGKSYLYFPVESGGPYGSFEWSEVLPGFFSPASSPQAKVKLYLDHGGLKSIFLSRNVNREGARYAVVRLAFGGGMFDEGDGFVRYWIGRDNLIHFMEGSEHGRGWKTRVIYLRINGSMGPSSFEFKPPPGAKGHSGVVSMVVGW